MFHNLEQLKERIKIHEGFCDTVYKDTLGKRTIGYGHLCTDNEEWKDGKAYTIEYLNDVFEGDFNESVRQTEQLIGNLVLHKEANEIIIEMVFQLGMSGVSKFKKMWAALKDQNYTEAANQMLDSKWAKQTPNRAKDLSEIMRSLA
ncbi:Phage-related lysozyme (muraminidase) (COG3772) [uncultured Mediterranean phage uvMED]|nr:Phage-related lysozyme (muraminidase) (COG3772) [uncultured Mediterranean phage uvMED]